MKLLENKEPTLTIIAIKLKHLLSLLYGELFLCEKSRNNDRLLILVFLVIISSFMTWIHYLNQYYFNDNLSYAGIRGQQWESWPFIFIAWFIHIDKEHLIGNIEPLIICGALLDCTRFLTFFLVSFSGIIFSGVAAILLHSSSSIVVGASGIWFCYLSHILLRAFLVKGLRSKVLAFVAISMYGYCLMGLIPLAEHVSWQLHLGGFLSGMFSLIIRNRFS